MNFISKNSLYLLLVFSYFFIVFQKVFAESKATSSERPLALQIQILDSSVLEFSKECLINGKLNPDPNLKWCISEKIRLDQDYVRLEKVVENQERQKQIEPNCNADNLINKKAIQEIDQAIAKSIEQSDLKECKQNTEVLSLQCAKDIGCATYQSLSQSYIFKHIAPPSTSCSSGGQKSSCIHELVFGILKDIFHNVKAIVHDVPKLLKDATIGSWNWLFGVEDKTSDALMLATQTTDKSLKEWAADKFQFMSNFISGLMSSINEGIKQSFGCGEWDGPPHFSNCLKPMNSWSCASCDQKLNAICGVIGYLGGEIVSMYLVGGGLAVTKAVISASKGKVATLGNSMMKSLGSNEKLASYLDNAKTLGTKTGAVLSVPLSEVSKLLDKVGGSLREIKIPSSLNNEYVKTISEISSKSLKVTTYPVSKYFKALGDACSVGCRHGDNVVYLFGKTKDQLSLAIAIQGALKANQSIKLDQSTANLIKDHTIIVPSNSNYTYTYDRTNNTLVIKTKLED